MKKREETNENAFGDQGRFLKKLPLDPAKIIDR